MAVARAKQARSWELRTVMSLARTRVAGQGAAHGLLAPVYGWFTEGFGTPDLVEAKQLLDTLA
jgi:predicted ATPase